MKQILIISGNKGVGSPESHNFLFNFSNNAKVQIKIETANY